NPSAAARSRNTRRRPPLLRLEALEDRTLPALTWSAGIALPSARGGDVAALQPDQSLLVLGGGSTTVQQLAPARTAWGTANALDQARVSPGVSALGGGQLLVYGGSVGGVAANTALVYDPVNAGNTHAAASLSTPRSLLAFAADGAGRAYAIGGLDA